VSDSNVGSRTHTEGTGVFAPFSSAITVASAKPPTKLFNARPKRERGRAELPGPLTDDDRLGKKSPLSSDANGVPTREYLVAGSTGLEPATSGVTGRRSNQLNYDPARSCESESEKFKVKK
jgi:hypothetical protein